MRKIKLVYMLLALALIVSLLAGCGGGSSTSEETTDGTSTENAGSTSGISSGEKVKLTALIVKHPLTKDVNTMQWLKDLEDKCNVDVEWQQISADWDQKKSTMFASGQIPDLLFNATTSSDYIQFNGLFEDLGPLIEKYGTNIKKMFNEHPETKVLATQLDGKIYATPKYQRFWPKTNSSMYINKKWLDNLGLNVPTTWDELYDVLVAFKEKDANGNGDPSDEIPMDFSGFGAYHPQLLLGSTGIQLTDWGTSGYFAEDGKVKNFFIDERYKRLVKFIHKCYADGLINPEAFTQDYSKFQSLARGEGKTAKVGFTWGWEVTDRFGLELADQYVTVPQLKESANSTDDLRWSYDYNGLNYSPDRVAMSAACKNKEAAMKFIDAFYDPIVSMQVLFGGMNDVDKCIKDNGDGSYSVLPPSDSTMDPGTWKWTNSFADIGPIYLSDDLKLTLSTDMATALKEKSVYDECLSRIDPKKDVYPQMYMKYTTDEINTMAMNQTNIDNITYQKWATWVTKGGVDEEWDAYVKSVKDAGLTQNLEIRQAAYENYLKTLK